MGVGIWPPITLLEIEAKLRENGFFDVDIIDAEAQDYSFTELTRQITIKSPRLAVLQATVPTLKDDLLLAALLKTSLPNLEIVFVGLASTTMPEDLLGNQQLDYVVIGQPEEVVCELARQRLNRSLKLSEIAGLGYKENGKICINKRRSSSGLPDYSVFPDYSKIDKQRYRLALTGKPFAVVKTSVGCDYGCSFCTSEAYYGKGWRGRSSENIVKTIEDIKLKQKIDSFLFLSDTFNGRKKFVMDLTSLILARGLKIKWVSNSRVDLVSQEQAALMKKSGCLLVSLGLESFDENILKNNNKFITGEQIKRGIEILHQQGILTYGYFILGLVGETRTSVFKTIFKAWQSKLDFANFYTLTPYPGTEYFNRFQNRDWKRYFHGISDIVTYPYLSSREINLYRYLALFLFYLRPRRLFLLIKYFLLRRLG